VYSLCGLAILALDISVGIKISVTVIDSSFGDRIIHWSTEKGIGTTLYFKNYEKVPIFTLPWLLVLFILLFVPKKLCQKVVHKICEDCFSEY
jgi:hypothetical protein